MEPADRYHLLGDQETLLQQITPCRKAQCSLADLSKTQLKKRNLKTVLKGKEVTSIEDLHNELPENFMSIRSRIDGHLALGFQEKTGAEISFDLVFDRYKRRNFLLVTRGGSNIAMSDHLFFFIFSPEHIVYPIFHTHLECDYEPGSCRSSLMDLQTLNNLKVIQKCKTIKGTVLFPNRKAIVYTISDKGIRLSETRLEELPFGQKPH